MSKINKNAFYKLDRILETQAHYYLIIGERSNGKTYACLKHCIEEYFEYGKEFVVIRRWELDIKGSNGEKIFNNLIENDEIKKLSKGKYTGVLYKSRQYYFTYLDENNQPIVEKEPFAYALALSLDEHYKSVPFPNVWNIVFDEFLTRGAYLPDEFIKFTALLSTIIRHRTGIKIFMCGNTVNIYSPYFKEMGLTRINKMKKGDIDVYNYGDSDLKVAVELSDFKGKKESNVYFAFNNPRLQMITGNGNVWEIDIYPHLPIKYLPKDLVTFFFIIFEGTILKCDVIVKDNNPFIYIMRKTTPIKDDNHIVYCHENNYKINYRKDFTIARNKMETKIISLFKSGKVFYQDNEVGEIVRNFMNTK